MPNSTSIDRWLASATLHDVPLSGADGAIDDGHRSTSTARTLLMPSAAALAELRFAHGLRCPRCQSERVCRWGRFADRQRYRCRQCSRTFSDFTLTPLAYTKRFHLWAEAAAAIAQSISVRAMARRVGIDPQTAFRWRHRMLDSLPSVQHRPLAGIVEVDHLWFVHSEKGSRDLDRPARRRGTPIPDRGPDCPRVWAVVARDRRRRSFAVDTGSRRPMAGELERALGHVIAPGSTVCTSGGHEYLLFCRAAGLLRARVMAVPPLGAGPRPLYHRWNATAQRIELTRWMKRFNGVASRYLPHYLAWHVFLASALPLRGAGLGQRLLLAVLAGSPGPRTDAPV